MIRALSVGQNGFYNESLVYLQEYRKRQMLSKLGFTSSLDELDPVSAEMFIEITNQIDKVNDEKRRLKR